MSLPRRIHARSRWEWGEELADRYISDLYATTQKSIGEF
jgi:hypothetical protein